MPEETLSDPSTDWRNQYRWYTHEPLLTKVVKRLEMMIAYSWISVEKIDHHYMPKNGACILACNHIHHLDPFFLGCYLPRYPHFMAKVSLFTINRFTLWYCRTAGAFPVYRHQKDEWAMNQARRVLEANRMLCIFPEGTRSRTGQLRQAKPGAMRLALEQHVPIVPLALTGTQQLKPTQFRSRNKVTLRMGRPLDVTDMAGTPPYSHELYEELTDTLMRRIAALLPPENRGFYA